MNTGYGKNQVVLHSDLAFFVEKEVKMKRSVMIIFTLIFVISIISGSAEALILDFEEFSPPSSYPLQVNDFVSQGFLFSPAYGDLLIAANEMSNVPNTGSNILLTSSNDLSSDPAPSSFMLTYTEGTFDLLSLRALEGRNTNTGFWKYSAQYIELLGVLENGVTVTKTIVLDQNAEENDASDSQLELISWTGLSSLLFTGGGGEYNGYSFGLDNIEVTPIANTVPEPCTMLLLFTGLIGLVGIKKKFKA